MALTVRSTNGRKCRYTDKPSDMNQHCAVRNTSVTSPSLDNLQLVIFRLASRCCTTSRCIFIHCTLIIPLSSGYSCVTISGYSLYHPTIIRVLTVLSSCYYHASHAVIIPLTFRVLIPLSQHYQSTHAVTIPLTVRVLIPLSSR